MENFTTGHQLPVCCYSPLAGLTHLIHENVTGDFYKNPFPYSLAKTTNLKF